MIMNSLKYNLYVQTQNIFKVMSGTQSISHQQSFIAFGEQQVGLVWSTRRFCSYLRKNPKYEKIGEVLINHSYRWFSLEAHYERMLSRPKFRLNGCVD